VLFSTLDFNRLGSGSQTSALHDRDLDDTRTEGKNKTTCTNRKNGKRWARAPHPGECLATGGGGVRELEVEEYSRFRQGTSTSADRGRSITPKPFFFLFSAFLGPSASISGQALVQLWIP